MGGPHPLVAACHSRFFQSHNLEYGHGDDQGDPGAVASIGGCREGHPDPTWRQERSGAHNAAHIKKDPGLETSFVHKYDLGR